MRVPVPRLPVDIAELVRVRVHDPGAIAEAAARRRRRPLLDGSGRLLIVAADHPARGALRVGDRELAMADRADLLGRLCLALSRPGVDGVLATASGLGGSSAYPWLKVPVTEDPRDMPRVMAASTLPAVLLGGDTSDAPLGGDTSDAPAGRRTAHEKWRAALHLPTVRGLVAGRALLYPADGDVAAAVDTATALLREAV
ncbi:hypothetical protein ABZ800_28915 [Streptomyces sp. NPDC047813]|uniref:Cgl0159 family (beta/alpha)8-fold protein n=1 Tax=Streptomyces sp. NPDC047813 TaxID=3154608 RepID=UPI0034054659